MKKYFFVFSILFQISVFAQSGTDIFLFDVTITTKGILLSNPVNVTNRQGYDNQPFFHKTSVYYSSVADSAQMDIKRYDFINKTTSAITHTEENEFSPTITPDGKFISCILQRKNGKQDLVKYPLDGGQPIIVIDDLKVGYHAWADKHNLLLFILEDTSTFGLHYYNTLTKESKKITTDIGRALQKIPGKPAISFIQKTPNNLLIKEYHVSSKKEKIIMPAVPNGEYHCWGPKGLLLMSDGQQIHFIKKGNATWQRVEIETSITLKNITRIALNKQNTKIAVVVSE